MLIIKHNISSTIYLNNTTEIKRNSKNMLVNMKKVHMIRLYGAAKSQSTETDLLLLEDSC